jgi:hypothetical protein
MHAKTCHTCKNMKKVLHLQIGYPPPNECTSTLKIPTTQEFYLFPRNMHYGESCKVERLGTPSLPGKTALPNPILLRNFINPFQIDYPDLNLID